MFCFAPNNNAHHLTPTFYVSYIAGYPAGYRIPKKAGYPTGYSAGRISGATLVLPRISKPVLLEKVGMDLNMFVSYGEHLFLFHHFHFPASISFLPLPLFPHPIGTLIKMKNNQCIEFKGWFLSMVQAKVCLTSSEVRVLNNYNYKKHAQSQKM